MDWIDIVVGGIVAIFIVGGCLALYADAVSHPWEKMMSETMKHFNVVAKALYESARKVEALKAENNRLRQVIADAEKQEPVAYEIQEGTSFTLVYAEAVDKYNMVAKENVVQSLYTNPYLNAPPECQTESEKTAYAFGWLKAHEEMRKKIKFQTNWQEIECPNCGDMAIPAPQIRKPVKFPTMPRQMWSGGEVQAWLDENVNKE